MLSKKSLAPVAAFAVAAMALAACGSSSSTSSPAATGSATPASTSAAPAGGSSSAPAATPASSAPAELGSVDSLNIGQEQAPMGFNNETATANAAETTIFEEGLLPAAYIGQTDVTLDWNHDLFTDEPMLTSKAPETIVYHINPKAVWSDGKPINADDFKYAWETQNGTNAKYMAASTTGYSDIMSVTGSDTNDQTVTVVFKNAYADWTGLFGSLLPAHIMRPAGVDGWNTGLADGLKLKGGEEFSGGPYIISSYDANKSLTEIPNPMWYGAAPKVQKLVFQFIEDTTQFPTALQNSELDIVNPQPTADEVTQTAAVTRLDTKLYPQLTFEHIDFNEANPFLKDLKVRQAIASAIDVKGVIAGTIGQFAPDTVPLGNRLILNNQKGYVNNEGTYGAGNTSAADTLLTGDGYTKSGGFYAKDGKTLEIGITAKNGNPLRVSEEQIMQAQLAKAGIKLDLKNTDKSIGTFLSDKDFDIALFAWVGGPLVSGNAAIYETAKDDSTSNYDGFSIQGVDDGFKAALKEFDPDTSISDYNAIDKMLWDDMVTLPLFQKPGFLAYPKDVANIDGNPTQDGFTYNVGTWGKTTS